MFLKRNSPALSSTDRIDNLYCFLGTDIFPAGRKGWFINQDGREIRKLIPPQVGDLLNSCRDFATIDTQAHKYTALVKNRLPQASILKNARFGIPFNRKKHSIFTQTKNQLTQMVRLGYLISEEECIRALFQTLDESLDVIPKISSVGLLTRNRRAYLERALTSYIENSLHFGRTPKFLVFDDAKDSPSICQMVQHFRSIYGTEISYIGKKAKKHFAADIIKEGIPPDVIHYALFDTESCGNTAGANRNALLLKTVGELCFSADDDTVCRISNIPNSQEGLSLAGGKDATLYNFALNRVSLLQSAPLRQDILELHEKLLGKTLGHCLTDFAGNKKIKIFHLNNSFYRRLKAGGRVQVTFNGLVGHSGCNLPTYIHFLNDASLNRLGQMRLDFHKAVLSGEIQRGVNRLTISDASFCMAGFLGLDNRELLPPFVPVMRGQDGVFGTVMDQCFPRSFLGHLPWALLHAPEEKRTFSQDDLWNSTSMFRLNDLIRWIIKGFQPVGLNPAQNLQQLGSYLTEWGKLPFSDFEYQLNILMCQNISRLIASLENRILTAIDAPKFWVECVRKFIRCLEYDMMDLQIPTDLTNGRTSEEAKQLAQRVILNYGQLLSWWPAIVEVARDLKMRE